MASGPSADFYAGWLRGYDLSGPVSRTLIAEAEKALAVARVTLTQLQQEAPSAAAVEASGAADSSSPAAEASLLSSTTAELASSSEAERFHTPPAYASGPAEGARVLAASAEGVIVRAASDSASTPEAAAPSAAASDEGQVPRPPNPHRRERDPWYSAEREAWRFPVDPLVKDPPEETLALAQQLEGLRSLTHRGQCVSGRERVVTAWRLGVADRDCAVHFYHPGRRIQTSSPSWLHCKTKQFYVILCATDGRRLRF